MVAKGGQILLGQKGQSRVAFPGITRHDRKRQRYKPLIENLGKLGITLDIISEEKAQAAWIMFVFAIPSLLSQVLFFNLRINIIED